MGGQDRMATDVMASIAVAVLLAVVGSSTTAAAQPLPSPPADPAVPAPPEVSGPSPPLLGGPSEQRGSLLPGLPADPSQYLLGQNPVPAAPGGPPGTPPDLEAFNNAHLLPQNLVPSGPGEGAISDGVPGAENTDLSRIDVARRLWHLYEGGYLRGSLLGQMPQDQLGEPLPGTAPPPGTSLPPGPTPPLP
ncbi:hypothetical protein [Mycolicibacterium hippocampi]|uniref:hypothetical protein n=1 Tax=Mycolicibacterium hippocampi TaxID=659824 RepID=UPI0035120AB6